MLDRTVAPPFNRTTRFDLLQSEKVTLKNGIDSWFISAGQQDVIKIELILHGGRWYEKQWGAAHFATNLLLKGTRTKTSAEIAQIFDLYGAHVDLNAGLDVISISLYSLNKYLEPALNLLFEVLTESIFPEKELEQSKSIFLENLQVNHEKTSFLASKSFRKNLFGETHPYGKELEEKDVLALNVDAVKTHYEQFGKDLFILVSGKVDDKTKARIIKTFSELPLHRVSDRKIDNAVNDPKRVSSEKEGSLQSSIRMGKRFIDRNHPDYADVLLLNHILGGYFGSRLMKNIREEKGLSYGIYSSIHTLCRESYLVIGSDVNKENLDLTFSEIEKELIRLHDKKIALDELEVARNHFVGSLQAELSTPFAHADKLKNILLFRLSPSYYQNLIHRLDTLGPEDLMKVADQYFRKESFYKISVG
jgi:predicted Zn-dependent peptidase